MNKKIAFVLVLLVVALLAAFVSVSRAEAFVVDHPVYVCSDGVATVYRSDNCPKGQVLVEVLFREGVNYEYQELNTAVMAYITTVCGEEGQGKCWYGGHVGLQKNIVSDPPEIHGFYLTGRFVLKDGSGVDKITYYFHLIDVGECRIDDGCLE